MDEDKSTQLPSFASESTKSGYRLLKADLDWILKSSGSYWNWPALASITAPTLNKLFAVSEHLSLTKDVPGAVVEFGASIMTKLKVISHLCAMHELHKNLYGFDHFKGYSKSAQPTSPQANFGTSKDSFGGEFSGLFVVEPKEVQGSLARFDSAIQNIYTNPPEVQLIVSTLPAGYEERREQIGSISLLYIDIQDVEVMKRLVPSALEMCSAKSLIVFEGYGLSFFPRVTEYVDDFLQRTECLTTPQEVWRIPFTKVFQVRD
jgi:hypothetical protein